MSPGPAWRAATHAGAYRPGLGLVRRLYLPRVLGMALGSLCVGAALQQRGTLEQLWLLLAFNALVWPHLAYRRALRAAHPRSAEHHNLLLDSLGGGFWLPAMGFNLLPSVLIATMLCLDNIAVGGLRMFARGLLVMALGAGIGGAALGWQLDVSSSLSTMVGCIPFLVTYPLVIGITSYRLSRRLAEQKAQLQEMTRFDALTGLLNKSHWHAQLDAEFLRWRRSRRPVTLMLLDLDHFKRINDEHGHPAGDEVLRQFARILRHHVRDVDVAGRIGGEEFAVIVLDSSAGQALYIARRVRAALAAQPLAVAGGVRVSVSVGIAEPGAWHGSAAHWFAEADAALYTAKREGRDTVRMAPRSPMEAATEPEPET